VENIEAAEATVDLAFDRTVSDDLLGDDRAADAAAGILTVSWDSLMSRTH
jgi:hypothetical protein